MQKIKWYIRFIFHHISLWFKIWISYPLEVILEFVAPALIVLPLIFYGMAVSGGNSSEHLKNLTGISDFMSFIFIGYAIVMVFMGACSSAGYSIPRYTWMGTSDLLFSSPKPVWLMTLADTIWGIILSCVSIGIYFIVYSVFFGNLKFSISLLDLPVLCMILTIGFSGAYGMGMMIAGVGAVMKESWAFIEIVVFIIQLFTPFSYSFKVLPGFLQYIPFGMPSTYMVMLSRHLLIGEKLVFASMEVSLLIYIVISIIWVIVGFFILNFAITYLRKKGITATY